MTIYRKVTFSQNGKVGYIGHITLPIELLEKIGITKDDRNIIVQNDDNYIIIRKDKGITSII